MQFSGFTEMANVEEPWDHGIMGNIGKNGGFTGETTWKNPDNLGKNHRKNSEETLEICRFKKREKTMGNWSGNPPEMEDPT